MKKIMEKILIYLYKFPYSRKRYIAKAIGLWQCNVNFLHAMNSLNDMGLIDYRTIRDIGNMEYYDEWYLTPLGKSAIIDTERRNNNGKNYSE